MAHESNPPALEAPPEDAERKAFRAHMARLRNKAALWDELRSLAIKRGVITPDDPHRVLRRRLVAAVEAQIDGEPFFASLK
jgi:hypothetical protein